MTQSIATEATSEFTRRPSEGTTDSSQQKQLPIRLVRIGAATMIMPSPARDLPPTKTLLVDRAYNDFCRLRDRGISPDPDQFCERFPSIRSSLIKMMQCHLFLADNPAMAGEEKIAVLWPESGETFLGFDLLKELGAGAFGRVFLAEEPSLGNRLVAVKIAKDFGLAEAKLLGRMKHPNIVPVYSVQADADTGLTAVCMPYVGSATLDDVLDHVFTQPTPRAHHILDAARDLKHPVQANGESSEVAPFLQYGTYVDAVRSLGAQIADALAFIHGMGICHRDLKPSNILISPQGVPMLLDFNLSTGVKDVASLFGGTLPFMSPEQLQAADPDGNPAPIALDGRSDIFSFGVILYQMLTGQHPYGPVSLKVRPRELRQQLLQRHFEGADSPRLLNPDIDPAFSRLIERCLAYNPNDRPQSATEIAKALRMGLTPQRRVRRWISRSPRAMAAGLLLCVTIGLAGAAAAVSGPRSEHPRDAGVQLFEQKRYPEARDKFNQAIQANPKDVGALLARAQTYQKMAALEEIYWQYALNDFQTIDQIQPSARNSACIGYCILKTKGPIEWARQRFHSAIDGGFASAEVYANLGYCQQQQGKIADAETNLTLAIQGDPRQCAAYFTRALVHSQKARLGVDELNIKKSHVRFGAILRDPEAIRADILKSVDAGIADVKKAIEVGPADVHMHFLAADLYGMAASQRAEAKDAALKHLDEAVRRGLAAKQFAKREAFRPLFADEKFKALCQESASRLNPPWAAPYLDPLNGGIR